MTDGIVVVDKPPGWTSHDVVARVRRLAGTRRVGHAGTLDPMATGVLVVGVGKATRLLGHVSATTKAYDATIRLGQSTTTDDAEGEVTGGAPAGELTDDAVRAAVSAYVGDIEQVPAAVSAVKVAGERAYRRVRRGDHVKLAARSVRIESIEVRGMRRGGDVVDVDVSVSCSSGTYVRALARDIGADLGVGGHLAALRRTRVGAYGLADARTLEHLERGLLIEPLADTARRCFPTFTVTADQAAWVCHGRQLAGVQLGADGPVAMVDADGRFLALYEQQGAVAKPVAVFPAHPGRPDHLT